MVDEQMNQLVIAWLVNELVKANTRADKNYHQGAEIARQFGQLQNHNQTLLAENEQIKADGSYSAYQQRRAEQYKRLWRNATKRLGNAIEHLGIIPETSGVQIQDYVDVCKTDNEYNNIPA